MSGEEVVETTSAAAVRSILAAAARDGDESTVSEHKDETGRTVYRIK